MQRCGEFRESKEDKKSEAHPAKPEKAKPETSCQGLFNQIHEKATKKVPEADFSS